MEDREIHWSEQLENLISAEGERCRGYAYLHQQCEQIYNKKNNYISIPVIILSTLTGATSMSSSSLFGDDTKISSIVIGLVSITVGILQTLSSFYQYAKKAESHHIAYLHYSKLFNSVAVELSLPREERLPVDQTLSNLRQTMERLAETTPSPPISVLEEFNKRFKDEPKEIARPVETNGLQKLYIYRPNPLKKIELVVENERSNQSPTSVQEPNGERRRGITIRQDISGKESDGKTTSTPSGKEGLES